MEICPVCGGKLQGRIDKIYCSAKCKNVAQYEKRIINERFYLFVDKQLKTNRRILKKFNKAGKATVRKDAIIDEGFNPKYFTHYWKAKNGNLYIFCYDYGFMRKTENNKEKYVLIQWQDYMN